MDVTFTIGHKEYTLQAQDGEERLLRRASGLLNEEAAKIVEQAGRMPEPRLLLLAGLMLADRLSAMEDRALGAEREVARTRQAASGTSAADVMEAMAELAARAEALAEKALKRYGVEEVVLLGRAQGEKLEGLLFAHPFYDERDIPILLGDHVSAEDGTGAVHTAPGHGQEDFAVSQKYGLVEQYSAAQLNPVDGRGVYLPSTPQAASCIAAKP